jgi:hypothetical protein
MGDDYGGGMLSGLCSDECCIWSRDYFGSVTLLISNIFTFVCFETYAWQSSLYVV